MSDYVRIKAIRYKPSFADMERFGIKESDDLWDLEETLPSIFGWNQRQAAQKARKPFFTISGGWNEQEECYNHYIDYVLEYEYGACAGDWGKIRRLYPQELTKYNKIFEQVLGENGGMLSNYRLVEYCYYNGCDATDYFDETSDPFMKEV